MNVLIVTPGYPPMPGGCERQAQAVGRQLVRLGHTVTIATGATREEADFWQGNGDATAVHEDGMFIVRYPIRPSIGGRAGLFAWRKLMVVLSNSPGQHVGRLRQMAARIPAVQFPHYPPTRPDIIHSLNISWEQGMMTAWRWAEQLGVPHVAAPSTHFGDNTVGRVAQNSMMQHQRAMLQSAAAVLTMTTTEEAGFHAWDVYPQRVVVTGNGLDALPTLADIEATRVRYQLDGAYAIFVGRATFDKGAIHAAQAAIHAKQTVVMIGSRTPAFDQFYAKLPPEQQRLIRHLGRLSDQQKHTLIAGSTCLLLPSRSESFGIVILEAWAHGKPVIAARSGGIPGLVRDGHDGLLVPFGDVAALSSALVRLQTNALLCQQIGANGRANIPNYTWERITEKIATLYTQLTTV